MITVIDPRFATDEIPLTRTPSFNRVAPIGHYEWPLSISWLSWRMAAPNFRDGRLRARSTHSPVKDAALPLAYRLNGSNLPDTGRSTDPTRTAAMTGKPPSSSDYNRTRFAERRLRQSVAIALGDFPLAPTSRTDQDSRLLRIVPWRQGLRRELGRCLLEFGDGCVADFLAAFVAVVAVGSIHPAAAAMIAGQFRCAARIDENHRQAPRKASPRDSRKSS